MALFCRSSLHICLLVFLAALWWAVFLLIFVDACLFMRVWLEVHVEPEEPCIQLSVRLSLYL